MESAGTNCDKTERRRKVDQYLPGQRRLINYVSIRKRAFLP